VSASPATAASADRLPLRKRLALGTEILRAYVAARRELRSGELRDVVRSLRETEDVVAPEVTPRRLAQATSRTLRFVPFDTRCLMTSLVVTRLLARRRIPGVFVLAVSPGPDFAAHSWVECDGRPILAAGDEGFGRLLEL
jgi:hypothetical protein